MLSKLREKVYQKVETAMIETVNIKVGPVKMTVTDYGEFVYVADFGRVDKPTATYRPRELSQLQAEVFSKVKAAFRSEGPEAALEAIEC